MQPLKMNPPIVLPRPRVSLVYKSLSRSICSSLEEHRKVRFTDFSGGDTLDAHKKVRMLAKLAFEPCVLTWLISSTICTHKRGPIGTGLIVCHELRCNLMCHIIPCMVFLTVKTYPYTLQNESFNLNDS